MILGELLTILAGGLLRAIKAITEFSLGQFGIQIYSSFNHPMDYASSTQLVNLNV